MTQCYREPRHALNDAMSFKRDVLNRNVNIDQKRRQIDKTRFSRPNALLRYVRTATFRDVAPFKRRCIRLDTQLTTKVETNAAAG